MWSYCIQESIFSYINLKKKQHTGQPHQSTNYKTLVHYMNVSLKFISCLTHPRGRECLPGQRRVTYSDMPLVGFRLAAHTPKILTDMHTDDVKMRQQENGGLCARRRQQMFLCHNSTTVHAPIPAQSITEPFHSCPFCRLRQRDFYLDTLVVAVCYQHLAQRRGSDSLQVGELPFVSSLCSWKTGS